MSLSLIPMIVHNARMDMVIMLCSVDNAFQPKYKRCFTQFKQNC